MFLVETYYNLKDSTGGQPSSVSLRPKLASRFGKRDLRSSEVSCLRVWLPEIEVRSSQFVPYHSCMLSNHWLFCIFWALPESQFSVPRCVSGLWHSSNLPSVLCRGRLLIWCGLPYLCPLNLSRLPRHPTCSGMSKLHHPWYCHTPSKQFQCRGGRGAGCSLWRQSKLL